VHDDRIGEIFHFTLDIKAVKQNIEHIDLTEIVRCDVLFDVITIQSSVRDRPFMQKTHNWLEI